MSGPGPRDRKALAKRQRELKAQSSREVREAMRTGDERHLPPRDQGPAQAFRPRLRRQPDRLLRAARADADPDHGARVRRRGAGGQSLANSLWFTTILLVAADILWLRFRLRRAVAERFPEEGVKGVTGYAVMRAINLRFLRLPKPQKKIGQTLDDNYR